jgi:hypothetical protein
MLKLLKAAPVSIFQIQAFVQVPVNAVQGMAYIDFVIQRYRFDKVNRWSYSLV